MVLADHQELNHLTQAEVHELMAEGAITVGVISDTHGLLRPQAVAALQGVAMIIHAGDVGSPDVLAELQGVAPTFAVRGNVDGGAWAARLPVTQFVDVGGRLFHVLHEVSQLDLDPAEAGFAAVVFGHSHQPLIEMRRGVLFLNPGSAGPRRFSLPIALARVVVSGESMRAEVVELQV